MASVPQSRSHRRKLRQLSERLKRQLPDESQAETLEDLRRRLREHRWSLVLGSGASHTVGIPLWRPLISAMIKRSIAGADPSARTALTTFLDPWSDNPLLLIRQLESLLGFRSNLLEVLRECLYTSYHEDNERILLEPICRLLLTGHPVGTQHVITYNFDNTLERCLRRLGLANHTVHSADTFADTKRQLRIYHPHGYLPHPSDDPEGHFLEESVVFSERDYHDQYMRPNDWIDALQLHHFMSRTCLFLGLSLSDPNTRRLLDHAHVQRGSPHVPHHFAIQKLERSNSWNQLLAMQLETLGVRVLWVRNYSAIGTLLEHCCT